MQNYVFKQQVQGRGCYAIIGFDIIYEECSENTIEFTYKGDPKWEGACKAGALMFYEYFTKEKSGRINIVIHHVDWLPVDSNNLIVMYACVKAFLDSQSVESNYLDFNKSDECFVFAEPRKRLKVEN